MATFTYPNNFSAGAAIVADEVNANFNEVRTFVTGSNLDTDNLNTPFVAFSISFGFGDVPTNTTITRRFHTPVAQGTITWVEANIGRDDGAGRATLQANDSVGNLISGLGLSNTVSDSNRFTTSFLTTSTAGGLEVTVTVHASTHGPVNGAHVTLFGKILLRS